MTVETEGSKTFRLVPGWLPPSYGGVLEEELFVRRGEDHEVRFELFAEESEIGGSAEHADGRPMHPGSIVARSGEHLVESVLTDPLGHFTLPVPAELSAVSLTAQPVEASLKATLESVRPGTDGVRLVLPGIGFLDVVVTDAESGEPIDGPMVYSFWKWSEAAAYERYVAVAEGDDWLMPEGDVELLVAHPEYAIASSRARVVAGEKAILELRVRKPSPVELSLEPPRRPHDVRMYVVGVEEVPDHVRAAKELPAYLAISRRLLVVNGHARLQCLEEGTYRIVADGVVVEPATFEVRRGAGPVRLAWRAEE